MTAQKVDKMRTVVIGGGQAGLSVGYHLSRRGLPFVILDSHARIGDVWRKRWDSLRLFTPAKYDGIDGMPFPAPPHYFPTKDEMADYLEAYASHFQLPVRTGVTVGRVSREGRTYIVSAGPDRFEAENVVVAMSSYQSPRVPAFARDLDPRIVQVHSSAYRNPGQLREGPVLIVGAGNSGAEIAFEVARTHRVLVAGRDVGHVPFRVSSPSARLLLPLLFRVVFHRILTVDTPIGRKARPNIVAKGGVLIRVKPNDLKAAGVERIGRIAGVRDGMPVVEGGAPLEVANIIWCTGFYPGVSWIDLPGFDREHEPTHERGIVAGEPGLYFVGLHFLYSMSSTMIHGVSRDAERIVETIQARATAAMMVHGGAPAAQYA